MFPGRHPSASSSLLLTIRQGWGWNLHWGKAVLRVLCQRYSLSFHIGQEGREGGGVLCHLGLGEGPGSTMTRLPEASGSSSPKGAWEARGRA